MTELLAVLNGDFGEMYDDTVFGAHMSVDFPSRHLHCPISSVAWTGTGEYIAYQVLPGRRRYLVPFFPKDLVEYLLDLLQVSEILLVSFCEIAQVGLDFRGKVINL